MKNILLKGALPFLLGVVVTIGVMSWKGPCCQEMMKGQQKEIAEMKKIVNYMNKTIGRQGKALGKVIAALPKVEEKKVEASKAAAQKPAAASAKK